MTDFIVDNDLLLIFGMITTMAALAVITIELINFLPRFMLSVVNRMKNKTLADDPDTLILSNSFDNVLDTKLESNLDVKKSLNENDLFKRFRKS